MKHSAATGPAGTLRGVDLITPAVGVAALVVYALLGFNTFLTRDLAIYSYAGQQVVNGVPPYEGIVNRAGPLAHFIPAIGVVGARIVGIDDVLGMRLFFMLISVACVCLVYRLGRNLFASRLAGLAAAGAFLSFHSFIQYAANGPRDKTPMVLFVLLALLAVANRRWFAAGFAVSLATLTWQPAFFIVIVAAVVAALAAPGPVGRIRALLRIVVGGVVPAAACVLYFVVVGAWQVFIDSFLLINARYVSGQSFMHHAAEKYSALSHGFGATLWVLVVGLVVVVVLAVRALFRRGWRCDPRTVSLVAVGAGAAAGIAWTSRAFNGPPDTFVLLPMAAIGIGALAKALVDRLSVKAAGPVVLAWVVVALVLGLSYSLGPSNHQLVLQRKSVTAVLGQLRPDASILSVQAPQPLVLSGKTNPTRYQMFTPAMTMYINQEWPGGVKGYGAWVRRERPTLIVIGGAWDWQPEWLAATLRDDYARVGRAPGWTWWVDRSVGHDVVVKLRRAALIGNPRRSPLRRGA